MHPRLALALQVTLVWMMITSHLGCWGNLFSATPQTSAGASSAAELHVQAWHKYMDKLTHHAMKSYYRLVADVLELSFRLLRTLDKSPVIPGCWSSWAMWSLRLLQPYCAMMLPLVRLFGSPFSYNLLMPNVIVKIRTGKENEMENFFCCCCW